MSSPGGVEFGGVLRLILGRGMVPRWRPSGSWLGYVGRQPEMSQDALHNRRLFNQPHEAQSPHTARTREDIEPKRAPHQLGPLISAGSGSLGLVTLLRGFEVRRVRTVPGGERRPARGASAP